MKSSEFFVLVTLGISMGIAGVMTQTYVSAKGAKEMENDNATLECTYSSDATDQSDITLEWTCRMGTSGYNVLTSNSLTGKVSTFPGCPGMNLTSRVSFVGGAGVASMNISDVRLNDNGTYWCKVSVNTPFGGGENSATAVMIALGKVTVAAQPASSVSGPGGNYTISGASKGDGVSESGVDWKCQINETGVIRNATYDVKKNLANSTTVIAVATVVCPYSATMVNTLQALHPANDGRIIQSQPVIVTCPHRLECCTTAQGTESTTVDGTDREQTIYVPAVTLLVLACVLFIASVVVIVFVVKFFLKCKKENALRRSKRKTVDKKVPSDQTPPKTTESRTNDKPSDVKNGFSPKLWLFVVFAVVAIIIAITFIAVGSVYLHSEGSAAVSVGLGLCIPFLIMDVFFIIAFVKRMIKVDKHQDENRQGTVVANPANTYENITSPSDKSKNYSDKSNLGRNINQNYNGSFNQQKDDKSSYDPNDPLPDYDDPKPDPRDPRIRSNDPKFDPRDPGIRYNYPEPDLRDPRIVYNDPKLDPTDPRIRSNASNVNLNVGTAL